MFKDLAETCVNAKEAAAGDEFRAGIAEAGRQSLQTGGRARGAVARYRSKAEDALGRSDMSDPAGLASDVATGFIPSPTAGASGPLGFGAGALAGSHIQRNLSGGVARRMAAAFNPGGGLAGGADEQILGRIRENLPGLTPEQARKLVTDIHKMDATPTQAAKATRGTNVVARALRRIGLEGSQLKNFLTGKPEGVGGHVPSQSSIQGDWARKLGPAYESPGSARAIGKSLEEAGMAMPSVAGSPVKRGPRGILGGVLGMIPSIALNISQNRAMRERGGASAQSALRRMTSSLGEAQFEPEKRRIALDLVKDFGPSKAVQALMQMTAGGSKTDPAEALRLILRARGETDEKAIDTTVARTAKRSMVGTHFAKEAFPGALSAANINPSHQSAVEDWGKLTGTTMPDVDPPEDESNYEQMAQYYNTIMDKVRSDAPVLPGLAKDIGGAGVMGAGGAALASRVPGWFGKAGPSFGRALPLALAAGSLPALYKHLRGKTQFTGGPEDSATETGIGYGVGGAVAGGLAGEGAARGVQHLKRQRAGADVMGAVAKDFPGKPMGAFTSALQGKGIEQALGGNIPRGALNTSLSSLKLTPEAVLSQMQQGDHGDAPRAIRELLRTGKKKMPLSAAVTAADEFRRGGRYEREGKLLEQSGKNVAKPGTIAETAGSKGRKMPDPTKSKLLQTALSKLRGALGRNRYGGLALPALGALGLGGAGIYAAQQ